MAYLNEYPAFNADKLNLDWLLEQYSTFDKRIAEIQKHFDEVAAEIENKTTNEIERFEAEITHDIAKLNEDFNEFKEALEIEVNAHFEEYEEEINSKITELTNKVNNLEEHIVTYIEDHIEDWLDKGYARVTLLKLESNTKAVNDNEVTYRLENRFGEFESDIIKSIIDISLVTDSDIAYNEIKEGFTQRNTYVKMRTFTQIEKNNNRAGIFLILTFETTEEATYYYNNSQYDKMIVKYISE